MKIRGKICCAVLAAALFSGTAIPCNAAAKAVGTGKYIALTFDDGPNTTTTNDVLDLLEKYDAKASFFLIGDNITEDSAKSVKRAFDMGCEICNHSKTHSNMGSMAADRIKEEIAYVDEWVEQITGQKTTFFRPPFIDVSQSMYDAIDLPFICGIDCQDYMENVTAEERADYILNGAKDGTIVLLHDAAGNSKTVEALKIAMPKLKAEGYEFVTLSELFRLQGETPKDYLLYTYVTKYPCTDYVLKENLFKGEVTGTQSDAVWQTAVQLDLQTIADLGDSWAIEIRCTGMYSPVINLQKWSGEAIWRSVEPSYYNGETACFLASDVQAALDELGVQLTDLDRIGIAPYSGALTMTQADLLEKAEIIIDDPIRGDVNGDRTLGLADAVALAKYLCGDENADVRIWENGDLDGNGRLNAADLTLLKRMLFQ
ncbi:MAG: polysaccharide deacetylase family protein [Oscillospiraceae bacterium]|nr:polysaccharide deacetylase family protein [Oscillospiraceae bacterium]